MSFEQTIGVYPKSLRLIAAILGVLIVGLFDYLTGYQVSFFLFYGVPILFSVWFLDWKCTSLIVMMSAVAWYWADRASGHPYFASWLEIWETVVRLVFFVIVAIAGTAVKSRRDSMLEQVANMNRMRELEREVIAASERARHRIGADLHDGLCQHLAGITCVTKSLHEDLVRLFPPLAPMAEELDDLLKDAVVQARNIARGIAPVHMDDEGIIFALDELAATVRRMQEIHCEFESVGEGLSVDCEMATHLYYIAQEAASNAFRHGHATEIYIDLRVEDKEVILSIRDNGAGIADAAENSSGMGLRSMKYRAGVLNGSIEIARRPEGGTRIECRAPLPAAPLIVYAS
ncbi:MAG TPA: sensor histidine kinase [Chthoniobacteraceae bacterium]|jgi:signal transduction histidine kinase|nr:sensor histidine kinase [Chthoniobacteraceae bacterium]